MSSKTIPSRTVLTCDRCGAEGEQYNSGAFENGGLHIRNAESWGRGWSGDTGGAHVDYDLCQRCSVEFLTWMQSGTSEATR